MSNTALLSGHGGPASQQNDLVRSEHRPPPLRSTKIHPRHLERLAVVYVRQSTPQQIVDHRESSELQYNLAHRAVDLGWRQDRVLVIDEDQGQSGRSAAGRLGFQRLLAEVGLDHVGLVLGIEMSRLARSCKDWHQLLELCALFDTLLADQDGLYDPSDYNDRLLLGLKGTMSEAELHILRNRMDHGRINKAQRGELFSHAPLGYIRLPSGEVVLNPDEQVQAVVRLIFDKFDELHSVMAVLRYFIHHGIRVPIVPYKGSQRGQLIWRRPCYATLSYVLHHPAYAGTYSYGRHVTDPRRKIPGKRGSGRSRVPMEQWKVLLENRIPAYITWERFLANQRQLAQNLARFDTLGVPREGSALLGGLIVCGRCNRRMNVNYRGHKVQPYYDCQGTAFAGLASPCQSLNALVADGLVRSQVLQALKPAALELSLRAADDVQHERDRLEKHWRQQMERARYQAERAERQHDAVEPENRLVARQLEQRWEQALMQERELKEKHDRFCKEQPTQLSADDRNKIASLASDIPALFNAPTTTPADRQTIIRYLVKQVVVNVQGQSEYVDVTIHWEGGFVSQHEILRPVGRFSQLRDYDLLKNRICQLRNAGQTSAQIASQLNAEGFRSPKRETTYNGDMVRKLLSQWGAGSQRPRPDLAVAELRPDEWWLSDLAGKLSMPVATLTGWCRRRWVHARQLHMSGRWWIVWADADELHRLCRLHSTRRGPPEAPYPIELITPKPRPEN
jgi:DNA invertase Pin-like site-specific DNA recombinase